MTDGTRQGALDRDDELALGGQLGLQNADVGNVQRDRNLGGRHGLHLAMDRRMSQHFTAFAIPPYMALPR